MIDTINIFNEKNKKYGYLKEMYLKRDITDEGCTDYQLRIVLADFPFYEGDEVLKIIFNGVKDLKIGNLEGLFILVFDIIDVSNRQLENIKYRIYEIEQKALSFYCKEIIFECGT